MKWFKHDSTANMDAKLQTILLDYGLEGYGLYWYCIELIAVKVCPENITFELEHDARIIARNTGSTVQRVEEMMRRFIELGLLEASGGVITCLKLAKRADEYTERMLRNGQSPIKKETTPDKLTTLSVQNPEKSALLDKIRLDTDKNITYSRSDEKSSDDLSKSFNELWNTFSGKYGSKGSAAEAVQEYLRLNPIPELRVKILSAAKEQEEHKSSLANDGQFFEQFPHVKKWIKNRHWENEIPIVINKAKKKSPDIPAESDPLAKWQAACKEWGVKMGTKSYSQIKSEIWEKWNEQ